MRCRRARVDDAQPAELFAEQVDFLRGQRNPFVDAHLAELGGNEHGGAVEVDAVVGA